MQIHPQSDQLRERLQQCLRFVQPWEGTFFRATTIDYANRQDLLAGVGSRQIGGRWTPRGAFNAVYGSLEPETAMAESLANYREFGIPVSEAMALVFVAVQVKLQVLLDLSRWGKQAELDKFLQAYACEAVVCTKRDRKVLRTGLRWDALRF